MAEEFRKVLIAASVYDEIEPFINIAARIEKRMIGGKDLFSFELSGKRLRIIVTGPGMVNASQALTAAIEADLPDIIIQTGCAGVFRNSGLVIGDVAIASSERDVHLGIESEDPYEYPLPLPFEVPGVDSKGSVSVTGFLHGKLYEIISESEKDFMTGFGPFITVSTVTATDERAAKLERWYSPVMESMEGAATAMVAAIYGVPFAEVRAASNYVGKRDRSSWNLPLAFRNACSAVDIILRKI